MENTNTEELEVNELTPEVIIENLKECRKNIEEACARTGRNPDGVTLLAVSKTKPVRDIKAAMEAGQNCFGENYVQEIRSKYEELGDSCEWHMIGHLQKNKVKYIIDKVKLIHSVDTVDLAGQIEKEAAKHNLTIDILLEVNIAGEESKWGFTAEETIPAARKISELPHVHIRGLMTSAPYTENAESNRVHFRNLKNLFDQMGQAGIPNVNADILSMGMTADYKVAVEEGATICRVGTAIFGARNYAK
ncbi:MAG: YggS family pyridoxal phosphate-dependent enzyme [Eubacterium sp.]|nr:YggS family pyridoxal phosphate-dependent enzyme [Eubacterium sp.]